MSDNKPSYIAIGVSLLISVSSGLITYGARAQQVDGQQRDIDRLERSQGQIDEKLDTLLRLTGEIVGELKGIRSREEREEREERRRDRD